MTNWCHKIHEIHEIYEIPNEIGLVSKMNDIESMTKYYYEI